LSGWAKGIRDKFVSVPESSEQMSARKILLFTLSLVSLIVGVSLAGLLHSEIYKGSSANWLAQTIGQDAIDLLLVAPILLVSGLFAYRANAIALKLWVGVLLYVVYTFLIYCFSVRFNILFIPYCLILGLSFYALLAFFTGQKPGVTQANNDRLLKITGIYFITIAVLFYALWLMEIIPATLRNETPSSTVEAGLYTNPVHVIDLALFLPATFIIGRLSLNRHVYANVLAPALLTFFVLMDLTIASLALIMMQRGLGGTYVVPAVMVILAAFSVGLLIGFAKKESRIV
jgi:hypothetical protein